MNCETYEAFCYKNYNVGKKLKLYRSTYMSIVKALAMQYPFGRIIYIPHSTGFYAPLNVWSAQRWDLNNGVVH